MRALLIEDDTDLREQITAHLRGEGFAVDATGDGDEGLFFAEEYALDIGIVDLGLPGRTGMEVIRAARAAGRDFPILILTARTRWQDKVAGLEAGADDYVVKPFQPEELLARVQALVRRSRGWAKPVLECGNLALDTARGNVTLAGAPVSLTAYEFRVLRQLMLRAGEVVSKSELSEHMYEEDMDRDSNVIEVFIRRLRAKLDPDGSHMPIETLRGRGYRLRCQD